MPVPRPRNRDFFLIASRGRKLLEEGNPEAYQRGTLLREMVLDPMLAFKVRPTYLRGDYETAVFQAFKEVEVRVRRASGFGNDKIGTAVMREA